MWTRSAVLILAASASVAAAQSPRFGVGRPPTPEEIRALGSAIAPDGTGLPKGEGTVAAGRTLFAAQCARCHGPKAEGDVGARLVGGQGTLRDPRPLKTVGSFWPYATTLWDYVNRAMPFDHPGSLTASEVYAAVAYVLNLNGIIPEDRVMDATSLPKVLMPNRDGFVADPRPDVAESVGTPRIPPLPDSQRTEVHRQLIAKFPNARQIDHGFDTLLQLPPLADAVMPYTIYLSEESTLSPRHRALLALRAAWLCRSQIVWADHAARARADGMSARDLHRIAEGPDAPGWDRSEATLLRLVDELVRNSSVSQTTWTTLAASYDQHHLMDAVETANHFTMLSTIYNTFGVQPDASTPDRLPTDVSDRVVVPARETALTVARVEPLPGDGIAVGRTFAQHPKLNAGRALRANFINRVSKLQPRHREMFILRIGWDCRSEYEWAQHVGSVGRARDYGLDPVRIAEGPDAQGWDPFEREILRAVDEIYRDAVVSDRTWAALAARYDTELLMSAVFTASSYRATSMALNAFGVQFEPDTKERFPPLPPR
jgi:alkylhydroperoxidase family enzyme/mono/diheme cytochrome c family protein